MKRSNNKLAIFLELMQLMDNAYIFKLKKNNPSISQKEISEKLASWYASRPGAELGDADGVVGDINRFKIR